MNKTSIEFVDFSWNPITGCRNGCEYCWAKKFNDRYFKTDFSIPRFHPERLNEKIPKLSKERNFIAQTISPDKPIIFTVDMGDIFSEGVEMSWIEKIFDYAYNRPDVNFLYLTKRPKEYIQWRNLISKNTFIGTSLDFAHNRKRIEPIKVMGRLGYTTFVNIEPLMSRMDMVDFSGIDFVVVGALTGRKYRPDPAWHKSINHPKIYYKKNYQFYFSELKNQIECNDNIRYQ
jgi:protein gp37